MSSVNLHFLAVAIYKFLQIRVYNAELYKFLLTMCRKKLQIDEKILVIWSSRRQPWANISMLPKELKLMPRVTEMVKWTKLVLDFRRSYMISGIDDQLPPHTRQVNNVVKWERERKRRIREDSPILNYFLAVQACCERYVGDSPRAITDHDVRLKWPKAPAFVGGCSNRLNHYSDFMDMPPRKKKFYH